MKSKQTLASVKKQLAQKETLDGLKKQLAQKDAEIKNLRAEHHTQILMNENLINEHVGLKKSFQMLKANYEREKNRLDGVIKTMFNQSKK